MWPFALNTHLNWIIINYLYFKQRTWTSTTASRPPLCWGLESCAGLWSLSPVPGSILTQWVFSWKYPFLKTPASPCPLTQARVHVRFRTVHFVLIGCFSHPPVHNVAVVCIRAAAYGCVPPRSFAFMISQHKPDRLSPSAWRTVCLLTVYFYWSDNV